MKTNPAQAPAKKISLSGLVEWAVLVVLVAVVVILFLKGNGFIDSSDIQPFPY